MSEIGIDISTQTSKSVKTLDLSAVDYIITLCADEVCPCVAGAVISEHWPLPDPATLQGTEIEQLQRFRNIRNSLEIRITEFKQSIQAQFKPPKIKVKP